MSKAEELASQSERIADARLEDDDYEWSVDADVQLRMCAAELRRLSEEVESLRSERTAWRVTAENAEKQLEDLKASIGEPDAWIWRYANGEEEVVFVSPEFAKLLDPTECDVPSTITPLYAIKEVK